MQGFLCGETLLGTPRPLWASTLPPGPGQSQSSSGPTGHPGPLGKFLICSETLFLVHKVRHAVLVVRLLMCG